MNFRNYTNETDVKMRYFILRIFRGQQFTYGDIRGFVLRSYPNKRVSDTRLRVILKKMVGFGLLVKKRLPHRDESGCLFVYAITLQGIKRRKFYQEKLLEQGYSL